MDFLESMLECGPERIIDRILYIDGKSVGVLRPSVLWGQDCDGGNYISGPSGIVKCATSDRESWWRALLETDAILFGEGMEIAECQNILNDPCTSRTASFFMAISKNCRDFISRINAVRSGKILIVGCGGIGSMVAVNLAGAGVRHLHIVDGDFIEESNLNRQFLWAKRDIGELKVTILKREIERRFEGVVCAVTPAYYSSGEIVKMAQDFDVVVITADEPLGLAEVVREESAAAIISSGYVHHYAQIQMRSMPTLEYPPLRHVVWKRNSHFIGPSFGPTNTELAGTISALVMQALSDGKRPTFSSVWDTSLFPRSQISKIFK